METTPALSALAERLLQVHAQRPDLVFYAVTEALGSMFPATAIAELDRAYAELERAGLMKRAGPIVSYFGEVKRLYRLTDEGRRLAEELGT